MTCRMKNTIAIILTIDTIVLGKKRESEKKKGKEKDKREATNVRIRPQKQIKSLTRSNKIFINQINSLYKDLNRIY